MGNRAGQAEPVAGGAEERLGADLRSALKRKPAHEVRLAGVVRALCPFCPSLRATLSDVLETLVVRGSYTRPLYSGAARALAEAGERRIGAQLKRALSAEDGGGLATLSAACFCDDPTLAEPLARIATSRHPQLALAAEVARVARRESDGAHVASLAPKIKESHRIELCSELFVPLLHHPSLPIGIAPALAVLRDAERHLGRWLVLGQIATRAGDPGPREEAASRALTGPSSARAAWAMVAWALSDGASEPPDVRPTVELVARLSDRPSSDRDTTFLYRLADARALSARPMLESVAKSSVLSNERAVRAALYLARDHGREDLKEALESVAQNPRREALRGLASAALWDLGERDQARRMQPTLADSRQLPTAAWAVLLSAAGAGKVDSVLTEAAYRRVQLGWID
ncbi:MAG: hypothetical protein IPI67_19270 [Myxococcales bacterium]|nr:hypothetical protein [Myxococcales bacterium]